jgi:hypothetical protein
VYDDVDDLFGRRVLGPRKAGEFSTIGTAVTEAIERSTVHVMNIGESIAQVRRVHAAIDAQNQRRLHVLVTRETVVA